MSIQANGLFKILSDDSKLKIVEFLIRRDNGSTCSDISSHIAKDLSTTFRHVEALRKANIVKTKKDGKFLVCYINNKERMEELFHLSKKIGD
jgi:DNA-binding transcriptional ArsR family regulator